MSDEPNRLRWGVLRRLEFIDFRLFWDGRFNRSDLVETFGISAQQASADIGQYETVAPANLAYDKTEKAYRRSSNFKPAYVGTTVERYLMQLVAIENEWMRQEDTWFERMPPVEIVSLGRRATDPAVLLIVLDAIRQKNEIDISYASLTGSPDQQRRIAPHAISYSAGRWYVRAWSSEHNDFRDYNLNRIGSAEALHAASIDASLDFEWAHKIDLVIVPNPKLPEHHRVAIEAEHGMEGGRLIRACRLSLSFYLMSELNLDVAPDTLDPRKQQLLLANLSEVAAARTAARQLSVEALARAKRQFPDQVG